MKLRMIEVKKMEEKKEKLFKIHFTLKFMFKTLRSITIFYLMNIQATFKGKAIKF